jgi:hypothetical protein
MKNLTLALVALALPLAPISALAKEKVPAATEQAEIGKKKGLLPRLGGRGNTPNAGPCPLMGVLYDNARIVQFASAEERYVNVAYTGEIRAVRGLCRYTGADPIVMNLAIDMAFGRGPKGADESRTYRYWVAVTRKDQVVVAKEYFEVNANFTGGADRVAGTDVIERIVIPRASESTSGANFEILVGFDLTPEQLAFNRDGKRFRVDVGG